MKEFFKPWRLRIGLVMLGLAFLYAVGSCFVDDSRSRNSAVLAATVFAMISALCFLSVGYEYMLPSIDEFMGGLKGGMRKAGCFTLIVACGCVGCWIATIRDNQKYGSPIVDGLFVMFAALSFLLTAYSAYLLLMKNPDE